MSRTRRAERIAFWCCAVVAALLHWIPHFPPQIDLAQHAAQLRFLIDWANPDFALREDLELHFFTPYLPAYALGALLGRVIPVVVVIKLLWSVSAIGTVAATVWLRHRLLGDPKWDWLVLPGLFGSTFAWGLLTFQLAVPFGLIWLGGWIRFVNSPNRRAGSVVAIGACLLFFCHALLSAWSLLAAAGLLVGTALRDRLPPRVVLGLALPLVAPIPFAAMWLAGSSGTTQAAEILWAVGIHRLAHLFVHWIGLPAGLWGVAFGMAFLLAPFIGGIRLLRPSVLHIPLLVTLAIIFAAPLGVFGTGVANVRFYALVAPTLVVALAGGERDPSPVRAAWLVLPIVTVLKLCTLALSLRAFDVEQRDFSRLLARMEPGRRVLSVVRYQESEVLPDYPWYQSFSAWYQSEKGGLVEFSFAAFEYPQIVRFRSSHTPIDRHFALTARIDEIEEKATEFDYVVMRTRPAETSPLKSPSMPLLAHEGAWWLYRVLSR